MMQFSRLIVFVPLDYLHIKKYPLVEIKVKLELLISFNVNSQQINGRDCWTELFY